MTLQEIIRRITEAENSLCNELKKDDLGFSADYLSYTQELIQELEKIKPTLSPEELETAKEFASAYAEHIKSQVKELAVERAKIGDEYRKVKARHNISNKYVSFKKFAENLKQ